MTEMRLTDADLRRFWAKVGLPAEPDGCLEWNATRRSSGYAQFRVGAHKPGAHRVAYEALIGPIPVGLYLDHLCRNPRCVNPTHLEPVTNRENVIRGRSWAAVNAAKTHCPAGHAYTSENTYVDPKGYRCCRTCGREKRAILRRQAQEAFKEVAP